MKMRQTAPQFRTASSQAAAVTRTRRRLQGLLSLAMLVCALASTATAKDDKGKAAPVTVRWSESQPGCTFSSGEDGKYRYGLWSGDIGIVFAVDAREVQIIRHRIEPIFGVFLTIRYRGTGGLDLTTDGITLQFMKHFKVVQTSLDPDDYIQKIQADADAVDDETRRTIEKHPEQKQAREARLQDYQKSVSELIEFLGKHSLPTAHLDPGNQEESGWVFFNTANKWIGGWKTQEEFILHLPLDGKVFEFPFKLPPKAGELLLRKRE
jgi:soluble cytochrome b562